MKRKRPNQKRNRIAAAAVEFAFVAPVVFLMSFAAFEFMRVSLLQSAADVASYEAARAVIVPGSTIAEAEAEASKYLNYLGSRNMRIWVRPRDAENALQDEIDDYTSKVMVRIRIPVKSNTLLLSRFFGDQIIESQTTLTFESYSGFYDGSSN